jgi:hypothetical protein
MEGIQMIIIDENYMIDVDKYNYTLIRDEHRLDKRGVKIFKTIGYYPTLESAISACAEQYDRDEFAEHKYTLHEAVELIRLTRDKFKNILKGILYS